MQIKGAMTVLNKRANWYGITVDQLIDNMDGGSYINETTMVLVAYERYKMDQGYFWSGSGDGDWIHINDKRCIG